MLTNITAAAWPTSGTATTVTTGLATLSGTSLVHVGSADIPAGSIANGYVEAASNTVLTVGINSLATALAAGNRYSQTFWVRFVRTGAITSGFNQRYLDMNGDGVRVLLSTWNNGELGMNASMSVISGGGTVRNLWGQGSSGSNPFIPYDKWTQFTLDIDLTVGAAAIRFLVNGMIVTQCTAIPTTGTANLAECVTMALQATGAKVQICGPFTSDNNETNTIVPLLNLRDSSTKLTKCSLPMSFLSTRGSAWSASLSGVTATRTDYAASGVGPRRHRQVLSGNGTATIKSIPIGDLPYNAHGWCTIAFPMLLLAGSGASTFVVSVRNAADSANLIELTCNGTNILQGSTVLAPFNRTSRYAVLLHFSNDNKAAITVINQTLTSPQYVWSAQLTGWTTQAIGGLQILATVATGDSPEVDGAFVSRYCDLVGIDSLSHGPTASLSPVLAAPNRISKNFPNWLQEDRMIPGCIGYDDTEHTQAGIIIGRSGGSMRAFWENAVQHMRFTHAVRLTMVDGGSINDLTGVSDANRVANFEAWTDALNNVVNRAVANKNRVWLTTMIRREQGTYTATQNREIDTYNGYVRALAQVAQRVAEGRNLVEFSEVAYNINSHASVFSPGDDVHPSEAGGTTIYNTMIANKTTNTDRVAAASYNAAGETLVTEDILAASERRIKNRVTARG